MERECLNKSNLILDEHTANSLDGESKVVERSKESTTNDSLDNSSASAVNQNNIVKSEYHCEDQNKVTLQSSVEQTQTVTKQTVVFDNIKMVAGAWNEFRPKHKHKEIFLKGCKWSPDGTCLLTNSDDGMMRLFDLPLELYNCQCLSRTEFPELQPSLRTKVGGLVYDYSWYPLMTSIDSATCCFATTSFSAPVQLWDAYTGELRASYRGFNAQDELHAALSVTFSPSGDLLFCGYKDNIKIFNTHWPGKDYDSLSTKELCEQSGIVSCLAVNPSMPNIFVAGTYSKTVGMYSVDGHAICLLTGQGGGLTQLMFSHDGSRLYAAGRKDSEILCWDLRHLGHILCVLRRPHTTNQRIYFDISPDGRYLISGSSDGFARVWDLQSTPVTSANSIDNYVLEPLTQWHAHNDCVNGLSVHRYIPAVATASGQRYVPELIEGEDDDIVFASEKPQDKFEDSVKLWWTGPIHNEAVAGGSQEEEI